MVVVVVVEDRNLLALVIMVHGTGDKSIGACDNAY